MENLIKIQNELKAPKGQYNTFGKYSYRSCEDILEALKPLLSKHKCTLTISDEILSVGEYIYVEATVKITSGEETIHSKAQAGINPNKKGMDIAQSFGASSSYARKYALSGLFLIDDNKDADTETPRNTETTKPNIQSIDPNDLSRVSKSLSNVNDLDTLSNVFRNEKLSNVPQIKQMFTRKKLELEKLKTA